MDKKDNRRDGDIDWYKLNTPPERLEEIRSHNLTQLENLQKNNPKQYDAELEQMQEEERKMREESLRRKKLHNEHPLYGGGEKNKSKDSNKKNKPNMYKKKIILGKERCIYKIPGSRKDYVKYKGKFIIVKDFIELNK